MADATACISESLGFLQILLATAPDNNAGAIERIAAASRFFTSTGGFPSLVFLHCCALARWLLLSARAIFQASLTIG
jgi:hypothetical protein